MGYWRTRICASACTTIAFAGVGQCTSDRMNSQYEKAKNDFKRHHYPELLLENETGAGLGILFLLS